jgi:hypothetical protein
VPEAAQSKPPRPATGERAWTTQELNSTVRKAEKGDQEAMADITALLQRPGLPDVLHGNPAREALRALLDAYAAGNPVIREAAGRKATELRAELAGPNPTPLEKLLVDNVLVTWPHLYRLEDVCARKDGMPLALGLCYQKCITAAHKRFLAAMKALTEVRRLVLPAIQVNIAKKQINVAHAAPIAAN